MEYYAALPYSGLVRFSFNGDSEVIFPSVRVEDRQV
jgi:hypothetical protein